MGLALSSCDDYLDRPTEDAFDTSNYYSTDAQCRAGVNYLYNSPWYDFMRGFFKVGEVTGHNFTNLGTTSCVVSSRLVKLWPVTTIGAVHLI